MGEVTAKCAVGDDSVEKMDALKEGELSMARVKVSVGGWIFSKSPWLASVLSFPQSGQQVTTALKGWRQTWLP